MDVNLLNNSNQLYVEDTCTLTLSKEQLLSLMDDNIRGDAVVLGFESGDILSLKGDLGSRYLVKQINYYTDANTSTGVTLEVSADDVSYSSCSSSLDTDKIVFTVDNTVAIRYFIIKHRISNLSSSSPIVSKINNSTIDAFGSYHINSSVVNSVYYFNASNSSFRFGLSKSWFTEAPLVNSRGKKREFPEHSLLVCTSNSLDIIDLDTIELWMRFLNNSGSMLGTGEPWRVFAIGTRVYVAMKNNSVRVINFYNDNCTYYTTSGDFSTSSTIANRNSSLSFSDRAYTTEINNLLSVNVESISGITLNGTEFVGLATSSGVSLIANNYAVYNSTDGALPSNGVSISTSGNLYWSGYSGVSGSVSYKENIFDLLSTNGFSITTFGRDGYWNFSTNPAVISEEITCIESV